MLANEIVYASFGFMNSGLESSACWFGMFAISCGLTSAGIGGRIERDVVWAAGDHDELDASPALIVMSAGSNDSPCHRRPSSLRASCP